MENTPTPWHRDPRWQAGLVLFCAAMAACVCWLVGNAVDYEGGWHSKENIRAHWRMALILCAICVFAALTAIGTFTDAARRAKDDGNPPEPDEGTPG